MLRRRSLSLLLVSLLFCTACPRNARNVREVPNVARISDDPAVNGRLRSSIQLPTANIDDPMEMASRVKWSPIAELDLKPNESKIFTVAVAKPSTLFARALWTGAGNPILLQIKKGNVTITNGVAYALPSDQGNVIAHSAVSAGEVNLIVRNRAKHAVKVQIVWGLLEEES